MKFPKTKYVSIIFLISLLTFIFALYHRDIPKEYIIKNYSLSHSKWVNIRNTDIHFTDDGSGDGILLIHGSGSDVNSWEKLSDELVRQGFRVVALDRPGSGLSDSPQTYGFTLEDDISFVFEFLEEIDFKPQVVIGHSTGGQLAWTASLREPDAFEKLILVSSTGIPTQSPFTWKIANVPLLGELMTKITPEFMVRKNLEDTFYDDRLVSDDLVQRYHKIILKENTREALLERMRAVTFADYEKLKCIQSDTLILWGKQDSWLPPSFGERFEKAIPSSKLILLNRIGHNVPEEADSHNLALLISSWINNNTFTKKISNLADCAIEGTTNEK